MTISPDPIWERVRSLLGDPTEWPALSQQMRSCIAWGHDSDGSRAAIAFGIYSTTCTDGRTVSALRSDWPRDFVGRCLPLAVADAIIEAR